MPVHYAPRAHLRCLSWNDEDDLRRQLGAFGVDPARTWLMAHTCIPLGGRWPWVSVIPHDPEAFARAFYSELHQADDAGAEWIIVEDLPDEPEWAGIADRLRRASRR
jgi:L-threonylcarbamoyladenylate synthase